MNQIQKLTECLAEAKKQSRVLRKISTTQRNKILKSLKHNISSHQNFILDENQKDLLEFKASKNWSQSLEDRLRLTPSRIDGMKKSIDEILLLDDPLHQVKETRILSNGLEMSLVSDSFGVILFIFEARPNVITEAFSLALKSGNVMIFKNGKEAHHSSVALYQLIQKSLTENGLSLNMISGFSGLSREETTWLLKQDRMIDLVIPRGGEALINTIKEQSRIPYILNDRGLCHLFIDESADLDMALTIAENAKIQRPGVCNSIETILIHKNAASNFLKALFIRLQKNKVEYFCDVECIEFFQKEFADKPDWLKFIHPALNDSFDTEYLDLKLNIKIVSHLDEALDHIAQHGSRHSEAIVTENPEHAERFQNEVDAAVAYWNSSTRFTDGFEFGFGGEIGISTQKLHVRGPVGLSGLINHRWKIKGQGQVRS